MKKYKHHLEEVKQWAQSLGQLIVLCLINLESRYSDIKENLVWHSIGSRANTTSTTDTDSNNDGSVSDQKEQTDILIEQIKENVEEVDVDFLKAVATCENEVFSQSFHLTGISLLQVLQNLDEAIEEVKNDLDSRSKFKKMMLAVSLIILVLTNCFNIRDHVWSYACQ